MTPPNDWPMVLLTLAPLALVVAMAAWSVRDSRRRRRRDKR
jgi:cytochrome c-type biogenesis protein CcmH/NrfF